MQIYTNDRAVPPLEGYTQAHSTPKPQENPWWHLKTRITDCSNQLYFMYFMNRPAPPSNTGCYSGKRQTS